MKIKKKKVFRWGLVVAALFILYRCVAYSDMAIAESPKKIANEAGFKLPDYDVVEQYDNMDRGASAWSNYTWIVKLKEPLSDKDIKRLNRLVEKERQWIYDKKTHTYQYNQNPEDGPCITIIVDVDKTQVRLEYMWWDWLS